MDAIINDSQSPEHVIQQLLSQIVELRLELAKLKALTINASESKKEPVHGYLKSSKGSIPIPDDISPAALEALRTMDIK